MRKKDDKLMQRIVECFETLYKKEGRKPSTRKIGERLGINASTVSRYLREMSDRNMLQYEGGEVKTSTTNKFCRRGMTIPILGTVSCGVPLLEEENIEAYYWLPEELFGKGGFFFLRANGDSMIGAGINDGDLMLIRRCDDAQVGQIVVALTDENENTLKRFYPEPENIGFMEMEAAEIFTPRVNVIGIPLDATKSEIAKTFSDTGFSRLPVYDDDIDHIVGIVYQKDFHNHIYHTNKPLSSIIRPALFVTENTKVGPLLKKMQAKKSHIAIIIDEFGGTDGIITMEDILEELVGEIWDEHDAVVQEIQKVSENEYLVTGTASIDKVYEELDIDKEFDVFTVSGWIMGILERVPKEGDHFVSDGLDVTVLKMADRRVDKVRIVRLPKDENEQ